jgi:hypothetical protein
MITVSAHGQLAPLALGPWQGHGRKAWQSRAAHIMQPGSEEESGRSRAKGTVNLPKRQGKR